MWHVVRPAHLARGPGPHILKGSMKHTKTNCTANHIILDDCGVSCANCGACDCKEHLMKTKQSQYEDEILDIIDHRDEFTRGDLQGVVSALVMKIMDNR